MMPSVQFTLYTWQQGLADMGVADFVCDWILFGRYASVIWPKWTFSSSLPVERRVADREVVEFVYGWIYLSNVWKTFSSWKKRHVEDMWPNLSIIDVYGRVGCVADMVYVQIYVVEFVYHWCLGPNWICDRYSIRPVKRTPVYRYKL